MAVGAAQPQVVGGHRAQLARLQNRRHPVAEGAQARDRLTGRGARHEVLALQLLAAARGELHPEVRQPVEPRAGLALLAGHRLGGSALEHVHRGRRPRRTEEGVRRRVLAALAPRLVDARVVPAREEADAVRVGGDGVEVGGQALPRQARVDVLAHREGRLEPQRQAGDDAERTERHDTARQVGVAARQRPERAVGADDLQAAHRRRERAVGIAGPVRAGRDRAGHRDVRQRREVAQRPAPALEGAGDLAVEGPAPDGRGARPGVDLDARRKAFEGDEHPVAVGEVGEGVPRPERPDPRLARDDLLQRLDAARPLDAPGVGVVAGPVRLDARHAASLPRRAPRPDVPTRGGRVPACGTRPPVRWEQRG